MDVPGRQNKKPGLQSENGAAFPFKPQAYFNQPRPVTTSKKAFLKYSSTVLRVLFVHQTTNKRYR
jgi:hypothetical protein